MSNQYVVHLKLIQYCMLTVIEKIKQLLNIKIIINTQYTLCIPQSFTFTYSISMGSEKKKKKISVQKVSHLTCPRHQFVRNAITMKGKTHFSSTCYLTALNLSWKSFHPRVKILYFTPSQLRSKIL